MRSAAAAGSGGPSVNIPHMRRLIATLLLFPVTAGAVVVILAKEPGGELSLRVGSSGLTVDTVTFSVPSGTLGNGQPIPGTPAVEVEARYRSPPPKFVPAQLTVDSSQPLQTASDQIPFTEFYWKSSNPSEIPSGRFTGSASQLITEIPPPQRHTATLTFFFDNDVVFGAGTYTGNVTYTLAQP